MSPYDHRVLIQISLGYPRLEGRLPRCYSPVCHFPLIRRKSGSFDLHALDTPPAFILSQDQTLNECETINCFTGCHHDS